MTSHPSHHSPEPWHSLPDGFADHLSIEARLSAPLRKAALDLAAQAIEIAPETILDLGSGTGADAVALAQRFPTARVHAVDVSPELLGRLERTAADAGVTGRIERHTADLNNGWPAGIPHKAELVWAALSMHHVSDPRAVLRQVFASLRPGGALIMTELTGNDQLIPDELSTARTQLSDRILDAVSAGGAHARTDWPSLLTEVGFASVERHEYEFVAEADSPDGAAHLATLLRRQRDRLTDELNAADLAGLDAEIETLDTGTSKIAFRSGRAVWVAVHPQPDEDGRADSALEKSAGSRTAETPVPQASESSNVDVVIIGGGSAGLAASVALARSRRKVVVIDDGQPRNALAQGAHNLLGNEGISPLELLNRGRAEAEAYGVKIVSGVATGISGSIDDFTVEVGDGAHHVHARRLVLATGLIDDLPDLPGIRAGWGRSVLHCPFCHGWEVRDQRIAILTRDEVSIHQAMLFGQLSEQVTVFLHEAPDPSEEQWEQLAALNVCVVRPRVERLVMDGAQVRGVQLEGGRTFEADAVVVAPRFNARTDLYEALGGAGETFPFGRQIPTDPRGMTPVPGVWAAGNASQPMAMVSASIASGMTAGAAVHGDLAFTELNEAVQARRATSH